MPFQSKAQQRFLEAKHPEIAKTFAEETPKGAYKKLPEHKGDATMKKHVGSHPKDASHMGHHENSGAHHHADGTHKMGAGKGMIEKLDKMHSAHSDAMAKEQALPHPGGEE